MAEALQQRVLAVIRAQELLRAGDRVAVAVSGGADSVALLRLLLELRHEIGLVLSVAHFNHQIRGAEADADAAFVAELAATHQLELHNGSADVPHFAREHQQSLETAARHLRREWFFQLIRDGKADKVATGHTLNDQAETVLMKFIRGAGTRGLAGIYPAVKGDSAAAALVRPLLSIRRAELESYLKSLYQTWIEDATNRDLGYTRNRVRHKLLPLLQRDYNSNVAQVLAETAEIARAEEEHWAGIVAALLPTIILPGKPTRSGRAAGPENSFAVDALAFARQPLALQRRLLLAALRERHITADYHHIRELLVLLGPGKTGKSCELPGGWTARRTARELQFELGPANRRG